MDINLGQPFGQISDTSPGKSNSINRQSAPKTRAQHVPSALMANVCSEGGAVAFAAVVCCFVISFNNKNAQQLPIS